MSKIRIDIPGWGNIDIKNIVIDYRWEDCPRSKGKD